MNAYLLSVIGTVLISAVITAIIPEGKTATVIRNVAKLACTVSILAPILNFFKTGDLDKGGELTQTATENFSKNSIQTDEAFIQYYCEIRVRETERALEQELAESFGVSAKVTLSWEMYAEEVYGLYDEQAIQIKAVKILPQRTIDVATQAKIREKCKES